MSKRKSIPRPTYRKASIIHATQTELFATAVKHAPSPSLKLFTTVHTIDGDYGTITGVFYRGSGWLYEIDGGRAFCYNFQVEYKKETLRRNQLPTHDDIPF